MNRIVLVNTDFRDRHTGEIHKSGSTVEMSDDRIAEVKSVNPDFITVIGTVKKKKSSDAKTEEDPEDSEDIIQD